MSLYVGAEIQEMLRKRIKCLLWFSVVVLFRAEKVKTGNFIVERIKCEIRAN